MRKAVHKTRCGGQWTEARFWGFIRSGFRTLSMKWRPLQQAAESARRPNQSSNKRLKWEFQCATCRGWFPRKQVHVDHIVEAGSLKCLADLPGFVDRLFCEADGFEVKCKDCHQQKTNARRGN